MEKLRKLLRGVCVMILFSSCQQFGSSNAAMPHIPPPSDSCDDPDAAIECYFINGPKNLNSILTIGDKTEPGERLIISGTVVKSDGKTPYSGVVLYAYQTDSKGYYSKNGKERGVQKWHGKLHGWCKTNKNGYYEIHTIKPAPYADSSMPAHIHAAIKLPDSQKAFHISDYVFKNHFLVNEKYESCLIKNIGWPGIIELKKDKDSVWRGSRNITVK